MTKYIKRYSIFNNVWEIGYYKGTQFIIIKTVKE